MIADIGLGVLGIGDVGRVVAVFGQAAYARFPGGVVALTTLAVPPGPIHVRGFPLAGLAKGDAVAADRCDAPVWRGSLPDPACFEGVDLGVLEGAASGSALLQAPLAARAHAAWLAIEAGDLEQVAILLGGLGPGLTPSGDDALAGLLLAGAAGAAGAELVEAVKTHEIARAFLRWAAQGQSIEPVHRLLWALAGGDRVLLDSGLRDLLAYGHSSGADLALGLWWGLSSRSAPLSDPKRLRSLTN
jgi:hypothetical protein